MCTLLDRVSARHRCINELARPWRSSIALDGMPMPRIILCCTAMSDKRAAFWFKAQWHKPHVIGLIPCNSGLQPAVSKQKPTRQPSLHINWSRTCVAFQPGSPLYVIADHCLFCMQVNGWKVVTTTNMAVIFFIFGVTLDTSELLLALKAWKAIAFGLSSILVLTPIFGFFCMLLPFKPYEFALGLAIMACVPTSLSSGVTLVIGAYGNGALALLFTVAGNILGIITAPLAVKIVLGSMTDAKVDSVDLLVKLGVSILMPVLVGKALRESVKPIRENVGKYKVPLYLINNLQITMIVWQKLSSAREVLVEQELGDVLLAGTSLVDMFTTGSTLKDPVLVVQQGHSLSDTLVLLLKPIQLSHAMVEGIQASAPRLSALCLTCRCLCLLSCCLQLWQPLCCTLSSSSSTY